MLGPGNQIQIFSDLTVYRPDSIVKVSTLQIIHPTPLDLPEILIHDPNPFMPNPEVIFVAILLLTLPIVIYLAYRYGKKMGRKEHTSPAYHDFGPEAFKRGISEESTSENSAQWREAGNSRGSSRTNSPSFNHMPSPPSSDKKDSPLSLPLSSSRNKRESSVQHEEEKLEELTLDDRKPSSIHTEGQMTPCDKTDGHDDVDKLKIAFRHSWEPSAIERELDNELLKEKVKLHSKDDQVIKKEFQFGVSIEKKDGLLQKTERMEVFTTYDQNAEEPETNARLIRKASQLPQNGANNMNIFSTSPKESTDGKTLPNGALALCADMSTVPSTAMKTEERSKPATEESKMETVIEKYGVPDETGKFKKIFKDVEWIGEGSFGEVCKVVHRLDGKNYAVKKVKLKLGRFEELKKESKVFREVFAMTDLHHPNIVRYSTCWVELEWDKDTQDARQKIKGYNEPLDLGDISENELSAEEEELSDAESDPAELSKNSDLGFDWDASEESIEKTKKKINKNEKKEKALALDRFMRKPTEKRTPKHARKNSHLLLRTLSRSFMEEELEEQQSKNSSLSKVESMCEVPGCKLYLYIQMEFCAGQSLKYYLENPKRKVEREKALEMFKKLLGGVNAIHSRGILHRDLKPANIFLDGNENVKIGDFGLASLDKFEEYEGFTPKQVAQRSRVLHSMKVGTPMYTSPEQESGGHYDQKTDIYSLGLIFYEMLVNFVTNHERYEHFGMIRETHEVPAVFKSNFAAESEIILRMTTKSPLLRPTAENLIVQVEKLLEEVKSQKK